MNRLKSITFIGTFSSDNLPHLHGNKNVSLIVNLSQAHRKGSHYIAIIIENDKVLYFDSFGLSCFVKEICNAK